MVAWTPNGGIIAWNCLDNALTSEAALLRYTDSNNEKNKLIRCVAVELALFHDRGAMHGDLKSSNILIKNANSSKPKVFFTDVDAAKFYKYLPWHLRIRDLARLYAALYPFMDGADARSFMRYYLKNQSEDINIRQLIVSVQDRAEKKIWQKHKTELRRSF